MFIYFHNNKLSSNKKGQLVPIFIIVLVVLIIMAFVTVNLSKVALFKTESANAADAGALAAGSVMANVFNGIAQANSSMETFYWEFYAAISASFVIATVALVAGNIATNTAFPIATKALAQACGNPCGASAFASAAAAEETIAVAQLPGLFVTAIRGIMIAITAYSIATYFHYRMIRDMAKKGRESAIQLGHQFAFMNSDIGSKLKEGSPLADVTEEAQKNNYRNEFSKFLDKEIGHASEYIYAWQDGQARQHYVRVRVTIDPVDTFKLKTTILPWPAELALLGSLTGITIVFAYKAAAALLAGACKCMACCHGITAPACCPCWAALCVAGAALLVTGIAANIFALNKIMMIFTALIPAWAGLLPGSVITSSSGGDAFLYTICWIENIDHNRRVKVDTWQFHQGAEFGVWNTQYPEVHSFSNVDFTGRGKIYPPELRHDASVVATDVLNVSSAVSDPEKNCSYAIKHVAELETLVTDALNNAVSYDARAAKLETEAQRLRALNMPNEAAQISASAQSLRDMAVESRQSAAQWQAEAEQYRDEYSFCFG